MKKYGMFKKALAAAAAAAFFLTVGGSFGDQPFSPISAYAEELQNPVMTG